jgi:hypothetical protein
MNPIYPPLYSQDYLLLVIHKPRSLAPRLADLPGLHLDEAAVIVVVNGAVGVVNLRAGEAFAGDTAWEQLLLRARRLDVHLIVLAGVGHFSLGYNTCCEKLIQFF